MERAAERRTSCCDWLSCTAPFRRHSAVVDAEATTASGRPNGELLGEGRALGAGVPAGCVSSPPRGAEPRFPRLVCCCCHVDRWFICPGDGGGGGWGEGGGEAARDGCLLATGSEGAGRNWPLPPRGSALEERDDVGGCPVGIIGLVAAASRASTKDAKGRDLKCCCCCCSASLGGWAFPL